MKSNATMMFMQSTEEIIGLLLSNQNMDLQSAYLQYLYIL